MEDTQYQTIASNYERIQSEIARAALNSGRPAGSVRLLVVTKAQPASKIRAVYQAGARLFGENYPEETLSKLAGLADLHGLEWHMIGHLQSRKAKIVADHFALLQSLDSLGLAEKVDRLIAERRRVLPVLLEVNVSGEESKFGFRAWDENQWEQLLPVIETICELRSLKIQGLMTMPPLFDDPEQARPFFQKTRRLGDFLASKFPLQSWQEISMGTSSDYRVAVEEGATIVRIGTLIMGQRPPRV